MHECSPEHLHTGRARLKKDKSEEEERSEWGKKHNRQEKSLNDLLSPGATTPRGYG